MDIAWVCHNSLQQVMTQLMVTKKNWLPLLPSPIRNGIAKQTWLPSPISILIGAMSAVSTPSHARKQQFPSPVPHTREVPPASLKD